MNFFLDNALPPKLPEILDSLTDIGATSIPILRADARQQLVDTAQNLSYQKEAEEVGKADRLVRQQVASCENFSQAPIFLQLQEAFQNLLTQALTNLSIDPFSFPINLNKKDRGSSMFAAMPTARSGNLRASVCCTLHC